MSETVNTIDPKTFPSHQDFYKNFDESTQTCGNGCNNNIDWVSDRCKDNKCNVSEHRIKKALGYIYHECGKDKTPSKEEAYHFLYYWLGDKLSKSSGGRDGFQAKISVICGNINDYCPSKQCKIPCDNPGTATFDNQKTIFDYYYDYSKIGRNLRKDGPNCDPGWSSYDAGVSLACNKVEQYCAGKSKEDRKEYCEEFKKKYVPYCNMAELSKLKCELKYLQERIVSGATHIASSIANNAASKATTTASLTSTTVAVGLQTILLLLYKYGPLSSWFGNHSGGKRNRRRRSTGNNLDASTDDSSTIASTFDPTEYSTKYNTRPSTTREGTANSNNRRGQHQHQQEQNISYHRM